MKFGKVISSVAVFSSLMISGSIIPYSAHAQKGIFLAPSSQWAVSKVDQQAVDHYCALARRFNQNIIFTLAKNEQSEMSFALDFQRPAFKANEEFRVILDPGAGQQRSYDVNPVSNKAFVVRLGSDPSFMSALETTGFMRTEIAGRSYNFNLSDIAAGDNQLNVCVASLIQPAAGGGTGVNMGAGALPPFSENAAAPVYNVRSAAPAGSLLPDDNSFGQEIETLKNEIAALKAQSSQQAIVQKQANVSDKNVLKDLEQVQSALAAMQKENTSLIQKLDMARKAASVREAQNISYQAQQSHSDAVESDFIQSKAAISKLEGEIAALARENEKLKTLVDSQKTNRDDVSNQAQNLIQTLSAENARLQTAMDDAFSSEKEALKDLQAKLRAKEAENLALLKQTANIDDAPSVQSMTELQSNIATLRRESETLRAQVSEVQARYQGGQSDLNLKIDALETENQRLKIEAQAMTSNASADLSDQINALKTKNNILETRLSQKQSEGARQISVMRDKIAVLEDSNAALMDVVQSNDSKDQSVLAEKVAKIKVLSAENKKYETQLVSMAEQIVSLETLKAERDSLKQQVAAFNRQSVDAALLKEQLTMLEQRNQRMQNEISTLNSSSAEMAEKLRAAVEHRGAETQSIASATAEKSKFSAQLNVLQADLSRIKADNQLLVSKLQNEQSLKEDALTDFRRVLKENERLSKSEQIASNDIKDKTQKLEQQLNMLNTDNEKLKSENEQFLAQMQGFQSQKQIFERQIAVLESDNDNLAQGLSKIETGAGEFSNALEAENKRLAQKAERLEAENASIKQQMERFVSEKKAMEAKINALHVSLESLQAENQDLKENLKQASAQAGIFQQASFKNKSVDTNSDKSVRAAHEAQSKMKQEKLAQATKNLEALQRELQQTISQKDLEIATLQEEKLLLEANMRADMQAEPSVEAVWKDVAPKSADVLTSDKQMIKQASNQDHIIDTIRSIEPAAGEDELISENNSEAELEIIMPDERLLEDEQPMVVEIDVPENEVIFWSQPRKDYFEAQMLEFKMMKNINQAREEKQVASDVIKLETADQRDVVAVDKENVALSKSIDEEKTPILRSRDITRKVKPSLDIEQKDPAFADQIKTKSSSQIAEQTKKITSLNQAENTQFYRPDINIANLLERSKIVDAASVRVLEPVSDLTLIVQQWQVDGIFGSSEQRSIGADALSFEGQVKSYLQKAESRCPGDFAVIPSQSSDHNNMRIDSYELACVAQDVSSSASLLFFNAGQTMNVVALEAPMEDMSKAMDLRDRVMDAL